MAMARVGNVFGNCLQRHLLAQCQNARARMPRREQGCSENACSNIRSNVVTEGLDAIRAMPGY